MGAPVRIKRSIIAIGEGEAEAVFLDHVKALYVPRGCGTSLRIKTALGKGGKGVLDYAERQCAGLAHDVRILLLDTDVDWHDQQRRRARQLGFLVVESTPCLEAWLLAIHRDERPRSSAQHKRAFEARFHQAAHSPSVYVQHFAKPVLEAQRHRVAPLRLLLDALGV
tara:strand:- start:2092 stop:2592 length:501 start_codon:yes stop_codon:yes gene_type:complete